MALAFTVTMILMFISFGVSTVIGTIIATLDAMKWSGLITWLESPIKELKVWHALFILLIAKYA